jgi:hypothetical protein
MSDYGPLLVSPFTFRCARCQTETPLIDTRVHGHDGEFGHSCTIAGGDIRESAACPCCQSTLLEMAVACGYQYADDDWPDCDGRFEDFFDAFAVAGKCSGCAKVFGIADFACA